MVALKVIALTRFQVVEFLSAFDPFCDDFEIKLLRHNNDGVDNNFVAYVLGFLIGDIQITISIWIVRGGYLYFSLYRAQYTQ